MISLQVKRSGEPDANGWCPYAWKLFHREAETDEWKLIATGKIPPVHRQHEGYGKLLERVAQSCVIEDRYNRGKLMEKLANASPETLEKLEKEHNERKR